MGWTFSVERVTGIEPAWPAWKAGALPLSYTREGCFEPKGSVTGANNIGNGKGKVISPLDSPIASRGVA